MRLDDKQIRYCVGNADILGSITGIPVECVFEDDRIVFLNELSKAVMSDRETREYPDVATFAFWIRKANLFKEKEKYENGFLRMGRGVVFHIAPSNVPVNFAYSLTTGFLAGNANIVRLPSREFPQTEIIVRAINTVLKSAPQKLRKGIVLLRYERSREINDCLSSLCDTRIIWGGDATIGQVRQSPLRPRANEITFADRYSICVINAEACIENLDKDSLAAGFYNDTYLSDQNACTSPVLICWLGEKSGVEKAKNMFWNRFYGYVKGKYALKPIQTVDKLAACCMAAADVEGLNLLHMPDNLITRMELNEIKTQIRSHRCHSGLFYEYSTQNILDLLPLCDEKLQTVSYVGDKDDIVPLMRAGAKGIDRIVPVGRTMDFNLIWDGHDLIGEMSRIVSI